MRTKYKISNRSSAGNLYGDIIEAEVGVFVLVLDENEGYLYTEELIIIPETNQFDSRREWEDHLTDMLLDLINDYEHDNYLKERMITFMSFIKDNYGYEQFEKAMENVR